MSQELENKIKEALENVKVWQRVPTSVSGVFLVKDNIFDGVLYYF